MGKSEDFSIVCKITEYRGTGRVVWKEWKQAEQLSVFISLHQNAKEERSEPTSKDGTGVQAYCRQTPTDKTAA